MFLLDWRLAVFALVLLPFFVLLTKRVGAQRRRIAAQRQQSMADISSLVQESLSVSGILLGKTMGRAPDLADRFRGESAQPGRPRGALAHGRPLGHGQRSRRPSPSCRRSSTGSPAWASAARRSPSAPWSPSPRCRRGCSSRSARCCRSRSTCRPRWRCSSASSSTSTCRSRSPSARAPARSIVRPSPARSPSTTSGSATPPRATGPSPAPRSRCRAAPRPRSWARPARARPRSATCSRASMTPSAAG